MSFIWSVTKYMKINLNDWYIIKKNINIEKPDIIFNKIYEYDDDGEFISGGDIWKFSKMPSEYEK